MLKAILFFSLFLPSIFCFANHITKAAATPKPITLTFFELTNKLTAQHKKQLDKVAWFLKRNKDYKISIIGGSDGRFRSNIIADARITNIFKYLKSQKKINKSNVYIHSGNRTEYHKVVLEFFKISSENNYNLNFDTSSFVSYDYTRFENSYVLPKIIKIDIEKIADQCQKYPSIKILISAGSNYGYQSQNRADVRCNVIKNYLKKFKQIPTENITFEKNGDLDDNIIEIIIEINNPL